MDLSSYAGQSVELQLRADTDSSYNSNLFIDDVGFAAVSEANAAVGFDPWPQALMPRRRNQSIRCRA